MFDILLFLFENYPQIELAPDRDTLTIKLHAAGFNAGEIDHALDWFSDLGSLNSSQYPVELADNPTMRVYAPYELERIDAESRGFLQFLQHAGLLNALQREWIIDRVLALDEREASLEKIKWIVLIVLWSQNPNQDYLLLEDMLFNNGSALAIH